MRAAVLKGGAVEVRETADPSPGAARSWCGRWRAGSARRTSTSWTIPRPMPTTTPDCRDARPRRRHRDGSRVLRGDRRVRTRHRAAVARRHAGELAAGAPCDGGPPGDRPEPRRAGGFGEYFLMSEAVTQVVADRAAERAGGRSPTRSRSAGPTPSAPSVTPNEVPLVIGCGAIGLAADRIAQAPRRRSHRRGRLRGLAPRHRAGHGCRRRDRPREGLAVRRRGETLRTDRPSR